MSPRFKLSLFAAFAATLPLLMAPSGGFPSKPTFQSAKLTGTSVCTLSAVPSTLCVQGSTNNPSAFVVGSGTTGQSFGLAVWAGTNTSDWSFKAQNSNGGLTFFQIDGAGNITGPSGVAFTPATFSQTTTVSGCTTAPGIAVTGARVGNVVTLNFPSNSSITCTSNATNLQLTNLIPASWEPAVQSECAAMVIDNGVIGFGALSVGASSTIGTLQKASASGLSSVFTNTGTKGLILTTCSYTIT